jgi:transcriptional regulator with XRE-family HTH domain
MQFKKGYGERLKNAIKASKYTQKAISELIQIDQDTLTNYIKEKTNPNAEKLSKICSLVNVSMEVILNGASNENDINIQEETISFHEQRSSRKLTQIELNDDEMETIFIYRELPLESKEEVKMILKYKAERLPSFKKKAMSSGLNHGEEAATKKNA